MNGKRVAVIGAGGAGLVATRCCLEEGLEPVCFEKNSYIGGLWKFTADRRPDCSAKVWKGLCLNAYRDFMLISDFPDEERYTSPHPTHEEVLAYLTRYKQKHDLDRYIRLNHEVLNITPRNEGWAVEYRHNNETKLELFDFVLVSTGRYNKPLHPNVEGLDTFTGVYKHCNEYIQPDVPEVMDKNVLVIGNSFSAGEVAGFVAHNAKQVWFNIGRGTSILTRWYNAPNPIPTEGKFFTRACVYSSNLEDNFNQAISDVAVQNIPNEGDYNLGAENRLLAGLVTSDILCALITEGRVTVKKHIVKIDGSTVEFDEGTKAEIDTIYAGTGYDISFPFLSTDIIEDSVSKMNLYKFTWPVSTKMNTLAFVGCTANGLVQSWLYPELQARWAVQVFRGLRKLPDKETMRRWCTERRERVVKTFGKDRGIPEPTSLHFVDDLASETGVQPKWWHYILTDPYLAYIIWYSPNFPAEYRLRGRGKWSEARRQVIRMHESYCQMLGYNGYYKWRAQRLAIFMGALAVGVGVAAYCSKNWNFLM